MKLSLVPLFLLSCAAISQAQQPATVRAHFVWFDADTFDSWENEYVMAAVTVFSNDTYNSKTVWRPIYPQDGAFVTDVSFEHSATGYHIWISVPYQMLWVGNELWTVSNPGGIYWSPSVRGTMGLWR